MSQTPKHSLIEAVTNTTIAFLISVTIANIIYPIYFPGVAFIDTIELTALFTVISIVRGYIIRRWFDGREGCAGGDHNYQWKPHEGTGTELGKCENCPAVSRRILGG